MKKYRWDGTAPGGNPHFQKLFKTVIQKIANVKFETHRPSGKFETFKFRLKVKPRLQLYCHMRLSTDGGAVQELLTEIRNKYIGEGRIRRRNGKNTFYSEDFYHRLQLEKALDHYKSVNKETELMSIIENALGHDFVRRLQRRGGNAIAGEERVGRYCVYQSPPRDF